MKHPLESLRLYALWVQVIAKRAKRNVDDCHTTATNLAYDLSSHELDRVIEFYVKIVRPDVKAQVAARQSVPTRRSPTA
jgi:hypothetical protein